MSKLRSSTKKPKKPVSEKTRVEDERLREDLRNADLGKLDRALEKAIRPAPRKR